MKEQTVEMYLVRSVKKIGGKCYKFVSPGHNGAPDRICIFPRGLICFVETKAPGKKPRTTQLAFHRELARCGVPVWLIDTKEKVDIFIRGVRDGDVC